MRLPARRPQTAKSCILKQRPSSVVRRVDDVDVDGVPVLPIRAQVSAVMPGSLQLSIMISLFSQNLSVSF